MGLKVLGTFCGHMPLCLLTVSGLLVITVCFWCLRSLPLPDVSFMSEINPG